MVSAIADILGGGGEKKMYFVRQSSVNAKATGSLKTTSKPCLPKIPANQTWKYFT